MFTNLNLTDMEVCYKVFRKQVLGKIVLEEDRFGFEPEITAKVARQKCRIYEIGISYSGRTYEEGKKVGWKDGVAREKAWAFLKRRWPALRRRLPPMLVTRPIEATPALGTRAYRRDVAAFFAANPVSTGARAVKQALERFDHDLELQDRAGPQLAAWLAERR